MTRRDLLHTAAAAALQSANAQAAPMTIIDTHVHLYDPSRPQGVPWPDPKSTIYRTFLPADYRKVIKGHGIAGMIEMECSPWVEDNYWVLEQAAKETVVVGTIGCLFPGKPDFREHLTRLHKNPLFLGIRFAYLWGRSVAEELPKPECIADLKELAAAGLTMDTGGGAPMIPDMVVVSDKVPELRIVIDHLPAAEPPAEPKARAAYKDAMRELSKRPNVYAKVSEVFQRIDENGRRVRTGGKIPRELSFYRSRLDEIYETFGPDRLLFASDYPNSEPTATFGQTLQIAREYFTAKGPDVAEKFFWKNSVAAYKWVKRSSNQPAL